MGISPRLPAGKRGCLLLFSGFLVLAGLLVAIGTVRQWLHFFVLSTSYAEVQGQVLAVSGSLQSGSSEQRPGIPTLDPTLVG